MAFLPASGSATEIWLPLPLENVSGVFWFVACGPGTVLTGGSLTAPTVIVNETGALWFTFGGVPDPLSVAKTSNVAVPELSLFAVNVSVPALLIAGAEPKVKPPVEP